TPGLVAAEHRARDESRRNRISSPDGTSLELALVYTFDGGRSLRARDARFGPRSLGVSPRVWRNTPSLRDSERTTLRLAAQRPDRARFPRGAGDRRSRAFGHPRSARNPSAPLCREKSPRLPR